MRSETPDVLNSLAEIPQGAILAVFGAGETGQEFVRRLRMLRPDVELRCFVDSFREGTIDGIPVMHPEAVAGFGADVAIIIASVFWNEIADIVHGEVGRRCSMLSNALINECSHLSSFGPFCFDDREAESLAKRAEAIKGRFRCDRDREIFGAVLDLRMHGSEESFFAFSDEIVRTQGKSFSTKDKYSQHLDVSAVEYAIEGGVFDGQDTFRFLQALKAAPGFKRLYAFDPSLYALYAGEYFQMIDPALCEFQENVLWDCEETVGFRVDHANPANSRVLRQAELASAEYGDKTYSAVSIDGFLAQRGTKVDLVKVGCGRCGNGRAARGEEVDCEVEAKNGGECVSPQRGSA